MEFPNGPNEQAALTMLESLPRGQTIVFAGASIDMYEDFDAELTMAEIDPSVFSTFDLHNPATPEQLRTASFNSAEEVPLGNAERVLSANESAAAHHDIYIAKQHEFRPFAKDVEHLIPQRQAQQEILSAALQEYAATYIALRGPVDVTETIMCKSCLGTGMTSLYLNGQPLAHCVDCKDGFRPLHPNMLIANTATGDSTEFVVDPIAWIANGDLSIRWRGEHERGIQQEGFILDGAAFIKSKFLSIGIDPDSSYEVTREAILGKNYLDIYDQQIDEFSFLPDELLHLQEIYANMFSFFHQSSSFMISLQPFRPTSVALSQLRQIVEGSGMRLGYTKKSSRYSDRKPAHCLLLVSPDGKTFIDIVPETFRANYADLNEAIEQAIRALEHSAEFTTEANEREQDND